MWMWMEFHRSSHIGHISAMNFPSDLIPSPAGFRGSDRTCIVKTSLESPFPRFRTPKSSLPQDVFKSQSKWESKSQCLAGESCRDGGFISNRLKKRHRELVETWERPLEAPTALEEYLDAYRSLFEDEPVPLDGPSTTDFGGEHDLFSVFLE
jgi:hypothetical protein